MRFKKFSITALASTVSALPSSTAPRAVAPLSVTLEVTNVTHIKALVINKGNNDLKLLKQGTLLSGEYTPA